MAEWTREQVEERLYGAADVMTRPPQVRAQGYYSLWLAKRWIVERTFAWLGRCRRLARDR